MKYVYLHQFLKRSIFQITLKITASFPYNQQTSHNPGH